MFLLYGGINYHDATVFGLQRRGFALGPAVYPHHNGLVAFDAVQALGVGIHQAGFHIFNRGNGAAHGLQVGQLGAGTFLQGFDLFVDSRVALKQVFIFQ